MDVTGWRAWYADGSVYDSASTKPEDLPDDGLLAVVEYLPSETPKRQTLTGYDFYFWWESPEGLVIGGNSDDRQTNEARYPGATMIRGKWTTNAHMQRIRAEMQAAREAP